MWLVLAQSLLETICSKQVRRGLFGVFRTCPKRNTDHCSVTGNTPSHSLPLVLGASVLPAARHLRARLSLERVQVRQHVAKPLRVLLHVCGNFPAMEFPRRLSGLRLGLHFLLLSRFPGTCLLLGRGADIVQTLLDPLFLCLEVIETD